MKKLPTLNNLSHVKKDELIIKLWEESLETKVEALKKKVLGNVGPKKTSKNSSNPPSKNQKANKKPTESKASTYTRKVEV